MQSHLTIIEILAPLPYFIKVLVTVESVTFGSVILVALAVNLMTTGRLFPGKGNL